MRWIAFLTVWLFAGFATAGSYVEIAQGALNGTVEDDIAIFRGIPYAADTGGANRWRPPQTAPSWDGVREAADFGTACPQELRDGYNKTPVERVGMGEDCLNLNVYTVDPSAKMPVMVWILPGSFRVGDASMSTYRGHALAKQGVVVVTFNYRLGVLGRFGHPALSKEQEDQPSGTYLLMDQIAALQWVQDNIAAFGGDPDNVTIFGMSAGGVSVNYHMALPQSKNLFHAAISQSGTIRVASPKHMTKDQPFSPSLHTEGQQMADAFGIEGDGPKAAQALRDIPWQDLIDWQKEKLIGSLNPALDGVFITESVGKTFQDGRQHPVPYVSGATSREGSLVAFLPSWEPMIATFQLDRARAVELYGHMEMKERINALETDFFYGSQRYLVKHHAEAGHPAYLYYFDRVLDEEIGEVPGAIHGAETTYVFQSHENPDGGINRSRVAQSISEADAAYSEMVSAVWVNIAKTGGPNGPGLPEWPRYREGKDTSISFDQVGTSVLKDFLPARMDYWEAHFDSGKL